MQPHRHRAAGVDVRPHYQGHAIIWEPMVEDGAGGASGEAVLAPSRMRSHISIPWTDYVASTIALADAWTERSIPT